VGSEPASGWPRAFAPVAATIRYQPAPGALVLSQGPVQSELQALVAGGRQYVETAEQAALPASMPILRALGQAGTTYIIAEGPAGLYLIDQHAAHERVLFERFLAEQLAPLPQSQPLLTPLPLELTPAQASLVGVYGAALLEHGFEVEPFGPGGYLLRSAPSGLRRDDPARAFVELLDLMTREDAPADPRLRVAASLACHAAVRAGQTLAPEEMRDLVRQLEACETPQTCPHGRPTTLHLSADELARRFARR
jgi:DNA mismatch repair protein MutL